MNSTGATPIGPEVRPVVIYDGECAFCRAQVERIRRHDPQGIFELVPRQDPLVDQRFPMLLGEDFNTGMRLVQPDGSIFVGADAVYEIARRLRPWSRLAWLYRVPVLRWVFRAIYAWVARHRMRLSCASRTCENRK